MEPPPPPPPLQTPSALRSPATTVAPAADAPQFAVAPTLQDIEESIAGLPEFSRLQFEDHAIFTYHIIKDESFPDPRAAPDERTAHLWRVRRECRGIVFCTATGRVLSRRYHKFFNVGEHAEVRPERLDLSRPHVVLEKLDGSMIAPYYTAGRLRFASKKGVTKITALVETFVDAQKQSDAGIDYRGFAERAIADGWSPIFEWCSRKNPIVLDYPDDSLVLTALRNIDTGQYMLYDAMLDAAAPFRVPVVKAHRSAAKPSADCSALLASIRCVVGLEGCVLRFHDGAMVKIKTTWYYTLTKGLSICT